MKGVRAEGGEIRIPLVKENSWLLDILSRFVPDIDEMDPFLVHQEAPPEESYVRDPKAKKPIPKELRRAVFSRDGHKCVKCGSTDRIAADHILSEFKGGLATMDNLQTLCKHCNSKKGWR